MLLSEQDKEKRRMLKEEWDRWVKHEEEKLQRQKLRDGEASDEEEEYEAKEIEIEEWMMSGRRSFHYHYGQE
ncbi:Eukaryotic translation initiation factor 3 subunit B [Spatholobus suberectus]|nr:Eukaryotic translation initiation factor 3 subunit B [Spatholobus suberectus]